MYDGSDNESDGSDRIDSDDVYNGRAELVLDSLSDLYLLFNSISVDASRSSSCLTWHCFTNYFDYWLLFKETVDNFGLRRPFYSRQDLKDTYCSFVYTSYKKTNNTELILERSKEYIYTKLLCLLSLNTK